MVKKKDVTVIMPYYKKIKYFQKTYLSLISQTYKNFNVIIIYDDKDTSELIKIKKVVKKKNFKFIINKNNIGPGKSRNKALKLVKTKYIAFLDCDDLWKKNKLEKQLNFMKNNKISFSHTSYNIINEKNNVIKKMIAKKTITYDELIKSCDIGLSTVIIEKKILNNHKFPNLKTKEDYILWLKIIKDNPRIYGLNFFLSSWRKSNNSISTNVIQKILDAFKVYYKFEKNNLLFSCIFTFRLSLNYFIKHHLEREVRI